MDGKPQLLPTYTIKGIMDELRSIACANLPSRLALENVGVSGLCERALLWENVPKLETSPEACVPYTHCREGVEGQGGSQADHEVAHCTSPVLPASSQHPPVSTSNSSPCSRAGRSPYKT